VNTESRAKFKEAGADDFLAKPLSLGGLKDALAVHLACWWDGVVRWCMMERERLEEELERGLGLGMVQRGWKGGWVCIVWWKGMGEVRGVEKGDEFVLYVLPDMTPRARNRSLFAFLRF
jgi:hypothetical protein